MGSLQKTALNLLVLSISLSVCSGQFAQFNCSEDTEKEYNEYATISCESNVKIEKIIVNRCASCGECTFSLINTMTGMNSNEQGRIFLVNSSNGQVAGLHIQKTKMSDQGVYVWYLSSQKGYKTRCTTLMIRGPETDPSLTMNGNKLTCVSSAGDPDRQILWSDGNGTDLEGKESLVSKEVEDGLTEVTSTLHGISNLTALECCCTVLYGRSKRNRTKCKLYEGKPTTDSPDTTAVSEAYSPKKIGTILAFLFLIPACVAALLYYRYRQQESRRNFAYLVRSLLPVLRKYENPEDHQSSYEA